MKIRVFAKRPKPLSDLNVVTINNFDTKFDVDLYQQIDNNPPTLVHKATFSPPTLPPPPTPPTPPSSSFS